MQVTEYFEIWRLQEKHSPQGLYFPSDSCFPRTGIVHCHIRRSTRHGGRLKKVLSSSLVVQRNGALISGILSFLLKAKRHKGFHSSTASSHKGALRSPK